MPKPTSLAAGAPVTFKRLGRKNNSDAGCSSFSAVPGHPCSNRAIYCGRLSAETQNNRLGLRGNSYWAGARIWERQFFRFRRFSLARTVGTGTNSQDRPSDRTISTSSPSGAFSNCSARCSSAYGKSYAAISRPKRRLCLLWPRSLSQTHLHPATPARSEVLLFS
jgi:hypothetical protein